MNQTTLQSSIKKILHVGPFQAPSNAYLRSRAFEHMGYKVERVDTLRPEIWLSKWPMPNPLKSRIIRPFYWKRLRAETESLVARFEPDLIYVEKGLFLDANDLYKIRAKGREGMVIAHTNPDDPFGSFKSGWRSFIDSIPAYDIHFVPKEENRLEYLKSGAKLVYVYDRSFDPDSHRPIVLSAEDISNYECDVGFIGSYAPHREKVLADVVRAGVPLAIWGDGWQKGRLWREIKPVWRGGDQTGDAYAKAICGMKIALHFLRRENRDQQDSRTFEIPACGSFMLAERTIDHERLFQDGVEAVYFDSIQDLLYKIHYFLDHPQERSLIAKAGYLRAYSSGYDHCARLRQILAVIEDIQPLSFVGKKLLDLQHEPEVIEYD